MSKGKETTLSVNLEKTNNGEEDRLSGLPDSVLITILSLLDPKEIIQTWLLSKRWCDLWRFVPCLDFCDSYSQDQTTPKLEGGYLERFHNFVSTFLRLRDDATGLHTFNLYHKTSPDSMSWIRYALRHNPKILEIYLMPADYSFDQTDFLFTCTSIVELSLVLKDTIVLDNVFLPKLRKARFGLVRMNQDSLEKFLSGCPVLESLSLLYCKLNANRILLQTVKKLALITCKLMSQLDPPSFSIFGPELEYLEFEESGASPVKFKGMSKVKKARISSFKLGDILAYNCEYLSSFSRVEDLMIDNFRLKEILEKELPKCPIFHNLKRLTLGKGCIHCGDFDVLSLFLKHCPNLELIMLFHKDGVCEERDTHNDLDAHELVRLLVESRNGMDQVQIMLS